MKRLLRILLLLAGTFPVDRSCLAQDFVWTEWETKAVEHRGPALSGGLLIYLHGAGPADAAKLPILTIFTEMAKEAKWDILRVNRLAYIDVASQDDQLLQFVALHVARARHEGYRKIIVAGGSRGGWLALSAAALADVDAVIGLAPGTWGLPEDLLKRQAGLPVQILAEAKVKRIAAFFFEGDPLEDSMDRAAALRRSLQGAAQSSFMVVDRPPDLYGHSAAGLGRFTRRYRDCLLQFVQSNDPPAGEVQCARSGGYAAGSDIGFTAVGHETELPPNTNPAFGPYAGRWEGDDEAGAYFIMESVQAGPKDIAFRSGYSPQPATTTQKPWVDEFPFRLDEDGGELFYKFPTGPNILIAKLKSETELEFEAHLQKNGVSGIRKFLLHKRIEERSKK
jgi:pimeloyl-ACP methyl ester carboxylesterase